jgi:hypothetical protein
MDSSGSFFVFYILFYLENFCFYFIFYIFSLGSIGDANFVTMKSFVKKIFQSLDIGENRTRGALLHFENKVYEDFNFLTFRNKTNIEKIIDAIVYTKGGTGIIF